jgi:hypothetical protein
MEEMEERDEEERESEESATVDLNLEAVWGKNYKKTKAGHHEGDANKNLFSRQYLRRDSDGKQEKSKKKQVDWMKLKLEVDMVLTVERKESRGV